MTTIYLVLIFSSIVSLLMIPVGVIFLIVYLISDSEAKGRYKKWLKIVLLSGFPLMIATFIIWAILKLIYTLFGIETFPIQSLGM